MQQTLPFLIDADTAAPKTGTTRRHIVLGGHVLPYDLRRSARRTIGLTIDEQGLHAAASQRVSIAEVEAFIVEKQRWVLRHLQSNKGAANARFQWQDGVRLPYLGGELVLRCADAAPPVLQDGILRMSAAAPDELRLRTLVWLKAKALELFAQRVAALAAQMKLGLPQIGLSQARTQWGSCTRKRDGSVRVLLHWKLIHFEVPLIDYVVAHELAHIRHMNHSPAFWREVARVYPDYTAARRALRERGQVVPAL